MDFFQGLLMFRVSSFVSYILMDDSTSFLSNFMELRLNVKWPRITTSRLENFNKFNLWFDDIENFIFFNAILNPKFIYI